MSDLPCPIQKLPGFLALLRLGITVVVGLEFFAKVSFYIVTIMLRTTVFVRTQMIAKISELYSIFSSFDISVSEVSQFQTLCSMK